MILVQAADVTDGGGGFREDATGHRRTRQLANAFGVRGLGRVRRQPRMLSGLSRRVPGLEGGGRDAVKFYRSNAALNR